MGLRLVRLLSERLRATETRLVELAPQGSPGPPGRLDPQAHRERGGCDPRGLQSPHPLHPRAAGHHDQHEAGARDPGLRQAQGKAGAVEPKNRYIYVRDLEALKRAAKSSST